MKTNALLHAVLLFLASITLFSCGSGGTASKKLSVDDVKKIIDVSIDGFEKKLDEKGLYGGPSVMFTRQTDKQILSIATNIHPDGAIFPDDLATAQMSFDKAYGQVTQGQVNGKNVYTQAGNANETAQYKAVVYQADYRLVFGANGKDATEIKKLIDSLVEKVTANLKK